MTRAAPCVRLSNMRDRLVRDHPEWWTVLLSACAWLQLVALAPHGQVIREATHVHHASGSGVVHTISVQATAWILMVVAMMFPLVLSGVEVVAARSLWRRRHRAIAGFLVGYSCLWLIPGLVLAVVLAILQESGVAPPPLAASAAFVIAGFWQRTPTRLRAVRACHRTIPLAPDGWRADRDCLRYGWMTARHCVVSCGPAMLGCTLAGHSVLVSLAVGWIGVFERYAVRPDPRLLCGMLWLLALAVPAG